MQLRWHNLIIHTLSHTKNLHVISLLLLNEFAHDNSSMSLFNAQNLGKIPTKGIFRKCQNKPWTACISALRRTLSHVFLPLWSLECFVWTICRLPTNKGPPTNLFEPVLCMEQMEYKLVAPWLICVWEWDVYTSILSFYAEWLKRRMESDAVFSLCLAKG